MDGDGDTDVVLGDTGLRFLRKLGGDGKLGRSGAFFTELTGPSSPFSSVIAVPGCGEDGGVPAFGPCFKITFEIPIMTTKT